MQKLLSGNKSYYLFILLFVLAGGVLLCTSSKYAVTLWVNAHWSWFLDKFVLTVNIIGTMYFNIAVVVIFGLLKGWRLAAKAAACFIAVMLVTQFTKHVLFPDVLRPVLCFEPGALRLVEGVKLLTAQSFPSGHTSAAFALTTFFALYLPCKKIHGLLALPALAVGYGRIYLSQHFITDVYAGMCIGVIITTLVYYWYPELREIKRK